MSGTFLCTGVTGFGTSLGDEIGHGTLSGRNAGKCDADVGTIKTQLNAFLSILTVRLHFFQAGCDACQTSTTAVTALGTASFTGVFCLTFSSQ